MATETEARRQEYLAEARTWYAATELVLRSGASIQIKKVVKVTVYNLVVVSDGGARPAGELLTVPKHAIDYARLDAAKLKAKAGDGRA